jgi:hypothetical protein
MARAKADDVIATNVRKMKKVGQERKKRTDDDSMNAILQLGHPDSRKGERTKRLNHINKFPLKC